MYADATLTRKGYSAEYFKNKKFAGTPAIERTDTSISFDWEYGAPAEGFPTDTFSVRWNAYHRPQRDERIRNPAGSQSPWHAPPPEKTYSCNRILSYNRLTDELTME